MTPLPTQPDEADWTFVHKLRTAPYHTPFSWVVEAAREGGVVIGPHSVSGDIPVSSYEIYYRAVAEFEGG